MTYIEIALAKVYTGGKFYTYSYNEPIKIGQIAEVPFGKKIATGVVVDIVKKPTFKTKSIHRLIQHALPEKNLELLKWMIKFYPDDIGLITQLFLPSNYIINLDAKKKPYILGSGKKLLPVNTEQEEALKTILNINVNRVLLHGDTGTGKTRVYMQKIISVLDSGKSVLVLTPEIGLTPQLHSDLVNHINYPILLTHSGLSNAKRRNIWQYAIANNSPSVFVGPRSALFLPIHKLGLIVIDEAHDKSYKQNQSPRYQSLHVAGKLASIHQSSLLQCTATPNIDDFETALAHNYKIVNMVNQAAGDKTNVIKIIDLSDRSKFNQSPYLSDELIKETNIALSNKQQAMFFLNRRGSARLIQCTSCGWQALCHKCGIPMIYHHDKHHIKCHWCGFEQKAPQNCPTCSSLDINFSIVGTKSLTEHISSLFPKAKIKRFDADSTSDEKYYLNIQSIKDHEVDIIIGTQLITKGLDLKELAIVGVINADTGMNMPDFRSEETTFQQLYQISGRAGRGRISSKTFIQSRLIDHPVMQCVKNHNWQAFYDYELPKRKKYLYPPFCYLAVLSLRKKNSDKAKQVCQKTIIELSKISGLIILGPSPSYYEKSNDYYNWQIILKTKRRSLLVYAASVVPNEFIIDIDPTSLL